MLWTIDEQRPFSKRFLPGTVDLHYCLYDYRPWKFPECAFRLQYGRKGEYGSAEYCFVICFQYIIFRISDGAASYRVYCGKL